MLCLFQDARLAQGANILYGLPNWDYGLGGCNTDRKIGAAASCQEVQNMIVG